MRYVKHEFELTEAESKMVASRGWRKGNRDPPFIHSAGACSSYAG
jgi:hypothetical protein